MELSIVVPAYNEGRKIRKSIEEIRTFCEGSLSRWEIVVIDDGSSDTTASVVAETPAIVLLRNERNSGKGFSVRRGMLAAGLDPVLFTDADLSTPIAESLRLLRAIERGADVAIASRRPAGDTVVERTPRRRLMARVFRLLVKAIVLRGFDDTQCGFKMFRRAAAREIFSRQRIDRWGFDVEALFIARKLGYTIEEVPVSWRESAETRLRLTTPLTMIRDLCTVRWNHLAGRYDLSSVASREKPLRPSS